MLREGDRFYATRSVQLRRDGEGRLVDGAGRFLQASGGGDVAIGAGTPEILRDGTVLIGGQPEARIGLFKTPNALAELAPGATPATEELSTDLPEEATAGAIYQGMVTASNVDLGQEMVELTRASRIAETGARVFQVYDDLLGKAATKLGEIRG
jgi:flagellar basal-body rod protein FlgG